MIIFAINLYFFIIQTKVYAFLASEFERNEPYFKGKSILFRKKFFLKVYLRESCTYKHAFSLFWTLPFIYSLPSVNMFVVFSVLSVGFGYC